MPINTMYKKIYIYISFQKKMHNIKKKTVKTGKTAFSGEVGVST